MNMGKGSRLRPCSPAPILRCMQLEWSCSKNLPRSNGEAGQLEDSVECECALHLREGLATTEVQGIVSDMGSRSHKGRGNGGTGRSCMVGSSGFKVKSTSWTRLKSYCFRKAGETAFVDQPNYSHPVIRTGPPGRVGLGETREAIWSAGKEAARRMPSGRHTCPIPRPLQSRQAAVERANRCSPVRKRASAMRPVLCILPSTCYDGIWGDTTHSTMTALFPFTSHFTNSAGTAAGSFKMCRSISISSLSSTA